MTKIKNRKADGIDAALREAALVEAEQRTSTPHERQIAKRMKGNVQTRLAELRRQLLPAADPVEKAKPIRPSLYKLGRDALVARLEALTRAMGGAVQYAHRDLAGLSDDDLRRMIDLLDKSPE